MITDKGRTLQGRLRRYGTEWLTFLDNPRVPPTNNRAEQLLRQLVILRKVTFGHRSLAGAHCTARLMTVKETAKQHGHRVLEFFYRLAVDPTLVRAATSLQRPAIPSTALGPRPRCERGQCCSVGMQALSAVR